MPVEQRKGKGKATGVVDDATSDGNAMAVKSTAKPVSEGGVAGSNGEKNTPSKPEKELKKDSTTKGAKGDEKKRESGESKDGAVRDVNAGARKGMGMPACMVASVLVAIIGAYLVAPFTSATMVLPAVVQEHSSEGFRLPVNDGRNRIRAFVKSAGPRDGDAVLLLHGMASSSFSFKESQANLATAGFYSVSVDLPGYGLSDKPTTAAHDIHYLATCLGDIIEALGLDSLHIVAADHVGAAVAHWYKSARKRKRGAPTLRSLTLVNTLLLSSEGSDSPGLPLPLSILSAVPVALPVVTRLSSHPLLSLLTWTVYRMAGNDDADSTIANAHSALLNNHNGADIIGKQLNAINGAAQFDPAVLKTAMEGVPVALFWSGEKMSKRGSGGPQTAALKAKLNVVSEQTFVGNRVLQEVNPRQFSAEVAEVLSKHATPASQLKEAAAKRGGGGGGGHSHGGHSHGDGGEKGGHGGHGGHGGGGEADHGHGHGPAYPGLGNYGL